MDCQRGCKQKDRHLDSCLISECWGCKPRAARDGWNVCARCGEGFVQSLAKIVKLWPDLDGRLGKSTDYRFRDRVSGTPDFGLVLNDQVIAVEASVREWVVFVVRVLVTEKGILNPPKDNSTVALLRFVAHHAEWLMGHELAADFVADARNLLKKSTNVAFPEDRPRKRLRGGNCQVETEKGECGGKLFSISRKTDGSSELEIYCEIDSTHRLQAHQYVPLSKEARTDWLALDEAAVFLKVPKDYVRVLASRHNWEIRGTGNRNQYSLANIQSYLAKKEKK